MQIFLNSWNKSPEQVSPARLLLKAGLDAFFLSFSPFSFFFASITCTRNDEIKDFPGQKITIDITM